ncbi:phosphotransferase family protein [Leucobacter tenebrionis]|uniref:phosphotransferase family protein n=1 Tax=Leucobacter tenebrionis TaxID=2873270 RepID=UPI001CA6FFB3|nr:aminoglycoside phosphotransferase family protein [Leucobacter tenebrionis]QZY51416.1 aminoglycoside phosphotransferase family protein [Leucobacter tenebrionis]
MSGSFAIPSAAESLRALAARDPALPDLPLVIDGRLRDEALGFETVVERLRYKPGASVVAAVRAREGGRFWVVSYSDPVKLEKSRSRARLAGAEAIVLSPRALAGPAHADRLLVRPLARAFDAAAPAFGGATVIRYNPLRRLVLRDGRQALKITADAGSASPVIARVLAERGLPVLVPEQLAEGVTSCPWWGVGDLSHSNAAGLARQAGEALAGVHALAPDGLPLSALDPARLTRTAITAVTALLPQLSGQLERLGATLSELRGGGSGVLSHGDWSADQVLTDGREVRIIDLDRAVAAPPEYDLGTYLACGGDPALLDGYREAGGRIDRRSLPVWRSLAVLLRATEPFRSGEADWPSGIERAVARAEEALL